MTALDHWNKQARSLWDAVFLKNYKTGKKNCHMIAAVHADNAVRVFTERFPKPKE